MRRAAGSSSCSPSKALFPCITLVMTADRSQERIGQEGRRGPCSVYLRIQYASQQQYLVSKSKCPKSIIVTPTSLIGSTSCCTVVAGSLALSMLFAASHVLTPYQQVCSPDAKAPYLQVLEPKLWLKPQFGVYVTTYCAGQIRC